MCAVTSCDLDPDLIECVGKIQLLAVKSILNLKALLFGIIPTWNNKSWFKKNAFFTLLLVC